MCVLHVQRSAQHSSGGGGYEDASMRICNNQAVAAENRITVRNLSLSELAGSKQTFLWCKS